MKPSNYNFFYDFSDDPSKIIAYNSLSNSLALVEQDKYDIYCSYVTDNAEIEDQSYLNDLIKGGFLIENDTDELKILRYQMFRDRFDKKKLSLSIAPTADCNFRCVYCYESSKFINQAMSDEIQLSIVEFVKNYLSVTNTKVLEVVWYGGEPLMAFSIVENLSRMFISICDEIGVHYSSYIVTNGYLLTPEIVDKLVSLKINWAQVTLDGNADSHNQKRPLLGNRPTFDRIIENLKSIKDKKFGVSIRINLDLKNQEAYQEILNTLESNNLSKKHFVPYVAWVEKLNSDEAHDANSCLPLWGFAEEKSRFDAMLEKQGYAIDNSFYTRRVTSFCGADNDNNFVIGSDGSVYSCWVDIGEKQKSRGNILEADKRGFIRKTDTLDYITYDPTSEPQCKECKLLPLCMGGCPRRRINGHAERCTDAKYNIEQRIKRTVSRLKGTRTAPDNSNSMAGDNLL